MRLGAVLPLCIRGSYDIDDLGRTEILFKSLRAFAQPGLFEEFLIVCPPDEVEIIQQRCQKWSHLNIKVVSEEVLVPELAKHRHVRGWRKQQMVKLAAPRMMSVDFYVTFDADAICLKHISKDILVPNGKALLQYEARALHPKWWTSSAHILKMSPDVGDPAIGMSVTPAIMSSELAELTGQEIAANLRGRGSWVDKLCKLHNPKSPSNWTPYRFKRGRWTEYSLYYLTAQKLQLLDQYHVTAGSSEYPHHLLIHDSHPFDCWEPKKNFSNDCPGLFCVVNSSMRYETHQVWSKIQNYIPSEESPIQ